MKLPSAKQVKEYEEMGADPPSHEEHNTEDSFQHPLSEKLVQAKCWNWRQEGNILKCDTTYGPLAQTIPTNQILIGEEDGLPVFRTL